MTNVQKETAQLLKEKGFDLPSRQYFSNGIMADEVLGTPDKNNPINWNQHEELSSAPTIHEATDWLRAKGVHVYAVPDRIKDGKLIWIAIIESLTEINQYILNDGNKDIISQTHDLALESGIIHACKNYIK